MMAGWLSAPQCRHTLIVAVVLLGGLGLRLTGLTRGESDFALPEMGGVNQAFYHFNPDEETLIRAALEPLDPLDPPLTVYGMLPITVLRGALVSASWLAG